MKKIITALLFMMTVSISQASPLGCFQTLMGKNGISAAQVIDGKAHVVKYFYDHAGKNLAEKGGYSSWGLYGYIVYSTVKGSGWADNVKGDIADNIQQCGCTAWRVYDGHISNALTVSVSGLCATH